MKKCVFEFSTLISFVCLIHAYDEEPCDVRARTEYGWVCGLKRWSQDSKVYASFRGVPFAKQPVGELRFKELQPPDPWNVDYDARGEGPVCPQHDEFYGHLTKQEYGMSEACIHANIHVPIHALPKLNKEKTPWSKDRKDKEIGPIYIWSKNNNKVPYAWSKEGKNEKEETLYESPGQYGKEDNDVVMYTLSKNGGKDVEFDPWNAWSIYNKVDNENSIHTWPDNGKYDAKELKYFWPNFMQEVEKIKPKYNRAKDQRKNIEQYKNTPTKSQEEDNEIDDTDLKINKTKTDDQRNQIEKRELITDKQDFKEIKEDRGERNRKEKALLPILVYIHGGGFNSGSGDADLNGPEYLVSKDVIFITFNYRINVFGFLSLNTPRIPGNNGLRDQITLLRWVQRNAKYFGGDSDNVTLMGQGSGAACAHLLSLSDSAKGLFKRVILQSGTGYQAFFITTPAYSATVTANFLAILGIVSTDPEDIHRQLTQLPLKRILAANSLIQAQLGLLTFSPVVETRYPGITTVLDKDPEILIAEGKGNEYPFIIGFLTAEAETIRRRLNYERYLSRVEANPGAILPGGLSVLPYVSTELGEKVKQRCLEDESDLDGLVMCYTETFFIYQAFRLARKRVTMEAAPTFLYQFSFESDYSVVQKGVGLDEYKGTAHLEDLTSVFRVNSLLEPHWSSFPTNNRDDMMKDWMTAFVINFMFCSNPTCHQKPNKSGWPQVNKDNLVYEDIETPYVFKVMRPTNKQRDMIQFYDKIYDLSGNLQAGNTTQVLNRVKG